MLFNSVTKNLIFANKQNPPLETALSTAKKFVKFMNNSPSPYHAVYEVKQRLIKAGFSELRESDHWDIKQNSKYFVTKNESTIIAFAVGGRYVPGNPFSIVAAHTDNPCLKVKPKSEMVKSGFCMVGVETYGSGQWHTWFDRDLTVAGRVLVKIVTNGSRIDHRLVHVKRPILRVPNIAIQLQPEMSEKFTANKETHLCPVLATAIQTELQGQHKTKTSGQKKTQADKHHPALIKLLCDELKIKPDQIVDFDLCLADTQPALIGGVYEEFVFSPRLDNLMNVYASCEALIESCSNDSLAKDPNVRMISLFDDEVVGSTSAQGANSKLQENVLRRISASRSNLSAFEESVAGSYIVSGNQAHAVHPNYPEKHEANHRPAFHKGMVIKFSVNQSCATTAITSAILREIASRVDTPLQDSVLRNDTESDSTIGPMMSANLGMKALDVGGPQLSMHSIREMCCTSSVHQAITLFTGFFELYPEVSASLNF